VTLSLFTPKYWYRHGQRPEFVVAAVSTPARACRFDLGAKSVSVAVSTGADTVWSSSVCPAGAASDVVVLARGKPALQWFTWDRRKSPASGCGIPGRPARNGAYTATAIGPHVRSSTMIFVLGAPGVAVP
jgi:hypothetical protein